MTREPAILYEPSTDTLLVELRPWPAPAPEHRPKLAGGRDAGLLHDALIRLCAEQASTDRHETVDRHRHGRQEQRRVEVFDPGGRLEPARRPLIACVARITRLTWCKNTRSGLWTARQGVAYHACQVRLDAATFGQAVRAHWGIENRAHHVRVRILREDDSRIRRKPGVVARIRSFALNLLRANGVANVSEALSTNALSLDRLLAYAVT